MCASFFANLCHLCCLGSFGRLLGVSGIVGKFSTWWENFHDFTISWFHDFMISQFQTLAMALITQSFWVWLGIIRYPQNCQPMSDQPELLSLVVLVFCYTCNLKYYKWNHDFKTLRFHEFTISWIHAILLAFYLIYQKLLIPKFWILLKLKSFSEHLHLIIIFYTNNLF